MCYNVNLRSLQKLNKKYLLLQNCDEKQIIKLKPLLIFSLKPYETLKLNLLNLSLKVSYYFIKQLIVIEKLNYMVQCFLYFLFTNMQSESNISQISEYDVIFIGNLAAVAADIMAATYKHFRIALLHFNPTVKQSSLFPLNDVNIKITSKPRKIEVLRQRIQRMNPSQKSIVLESGKKLSYKYLVHGEDNWIDVKQSNFFFESLANQYSRVYSNAGKPPSQQIWNAQDGNIIFYVSKGPSNFAQNYPFLYYFHMFGERKQRKNQFIILFQGESFFPNCPTAHHFLQQQLKSHRFKIYYNVTATKVDFLRRLLYFDRNQKTEFIQYQMIHYLIGQSTPSVLQQNGINPYNCHPRFLHNLQYDNVYVFGADILPTTHSFEATNHQLHIILKNINLRITHFKEKSKEKLKLLHYKGRTAFKIYLSQGQMADIFHCYHAHDYKLTRGSGCWAMFYQRYIQNWLTHQFYNFGSFGKPHYLWTPKHQHETLQDSQIQQSVQCNQISHHKFK